MALKVASSLYKNKLYPYALTQPQDPELPEFIGFGLKIIALVTPNTPNFTLTLVTQSRGRII
jgi:hypothetical protein